MDDDGPSPQKKSFFSNIWEKFFGLKTSSDNTEASDDERISYTEQEILTNLLKTRDLTVGDIMIPRAEIDAVPMTLSPEDLLTEMSKAHHTRMPVYRENLDDTLGMVHIKDLLKYKVTEEQVPLQSMVRKVLFVAPSMRIMDLLMRMKLTAIHMALVVDEYGGTDGLVTLDDIIEQILGDIEGEHESGEEPELIQKQDGSFIADARFPLLELQEQLACRFSEEESEEIDTVGGLIFLQLGRIPARGEVITHESGLEFRIIDADPRRIIRVAIKKTGA
jgi:hemolysin (HlyC) family protein